MAYRGTQDDQLAAPVRSIRVATTILDRFRAVMATAGEDINRAIGEADQMYPEIWRHLDEGARALEKAGRNIDDYKGIRKQELATFGVTDVDVTQQLDYTALMFGRLAVKTTKTASFNVAGFKVAREACNSLMKTLPEIDWTALAKAEDREIAAAGSMRAGTWIGAIKWFAIAGALVGISILLFNLFNRSTGIVDDTPAGRAAAEDRATAKLLEARDKRVRELQVAELAYRETCSPADRAAFLEVLRTHGQLTEAKKVEAERCRPVRPNCRERELIGQILAKKLGVVQDDQMQVQCKGIVGRDASGGLQQALFVELAGASESQGGYYVYRGVLTADKQEIVPVGPSIEERFIGTADLDDDDVDEIISVGPETIVVSRVKGDRLSDVEGPVLPPGCVADIQVEADFRDKRQGERKYIVINVPEPEDDKAKAKAAKAKCLAPGRHYYGLVSGEFAEVP